MHKQNRRVVPEGFVKTSFEITESAKFALEDLKTSLRRKAGYAGISEAAIVETLVIEAKKTGVNTDVLDSVIRRRKRLQDAAEGARGQ